MNTSAISLGRSKSSTRLVGIEPLESRTLLSTTYSVSPVAAFQGIAGLSTFLDAAGNIYGVNDKSQNTSGILYEIPQGSATPITIGTPSDAGIALYRGQIAVTPAGNVFGIGTVPVPSSNDTQYVIFERSAGTTGVGVVSTLPIHTEAHDLISDPSGNLYCVTRVVGGDESIAQINPTTGAVTPLAQIQFDSGNGNLPYSLASDALGNLYGTLSEININYLFELPVGASVVRTTPSYSLAGVTDDPLAIDSAGSIYRAGFGSTDPDVILKVDAAGVTTQLAPLPKHFQTYGGVQYPLYAEDSFYKPGMAVDASGDVFAVVIDGVSPGVGRVVEIPAGATDSVTIGTFNDPDGQRPSGDIVAGPDGSLYVYTSDATLTTVANNSELFKLTPASAAAAPAHLTLTAPAYVAAGEPTSPVAVSVVDGTGQVQSSADGVSVQLSVEPYLWSDDAIDHNLPAITVTPPLPTLPAFAVIPTTIQSGTATFGTLTFADDGGQPFALVASVPGFATVVSSKLSPSTAATSLQFSPGSAPALAGFGPGTAGIPALQVQVLDTNGIPFAGADQPTISLTETAGREKVAGTTTLVCTRGVATFSDLTVSEAGDYAFTASASDGLTAGPFNVTVSKLETTVTFLSGQSLASAPGNLLTLTATVTATLPDGSDAPAVGGAVEFNTASGTVATAVVGIDGVAKLPFVYFGGAETVHAAYRGDARYAESVSPDVTVSPTPAATGIGNPSVTIAHSTLHRLLLAGVAAHGAVGVSLGATNAISPGKATVEIDLTLADVSGVASVVLAHRAVTIGGRAMKLSIPVTVPGTLAVGGYMLSARVIDSAGKATAGVAVPGFAVQAFQPAVYAAMKFSITDQRTGHPTPASIALINDGNGGAAGAATLTIRDETGAVCYRQRRSLRLLPGRFTSGHVLVDTRKLTDGVHKFVLDVQLGGQIIESDEVTLIIGTDTTITL